MRDLTEIIVALSRVQSDLRALNAHHFAYPDDPVAEQTIVNLVMVLQARVSQWMHQDGDERRTVERRRVPTRRQQERRNHADRSDGLSVPSVS